MRRDIRATSYFCSSELRWRSTECVLLPCFNAFVDYFCSHELLCLRRPLIIYVHCSDTLLPTTTGKESACRYAQGGRMLEAWRANQSFWECACSPCAPTTNTSAFHNSIAGNFMVYQDRLETNLLQIFRHPGNSEWFSIISVIIFEVNIVDEHKQT